MLDETAISVSTIYETDLVETAIPIEDQGVLEKALSLGEGLSTQFSLETQKLNAIIKEIIEHNADFVEELKCCNDVEALQMLENLISNHLLLKMFENEEPGVTRINDNADLKDTVVEAFFGTAPNMLTTDIYSATAQLIEEGLKDKFGNEKILWVTIEEIIINQLASNTNFIQSLTNQSKSEVLQIVLDYLDPDKTQL